MSAAESLYPPSITGVPANLTVASSKYRRSVVVVLFSLILFMVFYLALVAGAGYLVYFAITFPPLGPGFWELFFKLGCIVVTGMLFFFLVKGLFKRRKPETDLQLEVTEAEHPALFAFVRKLCQETGAPFPYRIYISPDVNASVFYNSSLLNLLFPVRKNLLIGLGLVNALTLSEFKAVLAHEFGHFAQSSMTLGSYVYTANRVIANMVYERDSFDRFLAQWRRLNIRIAVFGHFVYGIVWLLRKVLAGAFRGINFVERALSRQMEFHADLVAVSVTGSDSLIHALSRLDFANESLMKGFKDLKAAADHGLYSKDMFYHQTKAGEHLRAVNSKPALGLPPALPEDPVARIQVFQPGDEGIPSMWASHPSNFDREENAKRFYLRSIEDNRSPWLLFHAPAAVRSAMSVRFYREVLDLPPISGFSEPDVVQAFIDEENAETTQDARYHGLYDGRMIRPGELRTLVDAVYTRPWHPQQIGAVYTQLYNSGFKERFDKYQERRNDRQFLQGLSDGDLKLKGKTFTFRGAERRHGDIKGLIERIDKELEADGEWLQQFDAGVFQAHYQMAVQNGAGDDRDLWSRYGFHLAVQDILRTMNVQRNNLDNLFGYLKKREGQLQKGDMQQIIAQLRQARAAVHEAMTAAYNLGLPPLSNMPTGQPLGPYLLNEPIVADIPPDTRSINGEWINSLTQQILHIQEKSRRIHFKSLGAILGLQEKIAGQWRARMEATAVTTPARPSVVSTPAASGSDTTNL